MQPNPKLVRVVRAIVQGGFLLLVALWVVWFVAIQFLFRPGRHL